MDVNGKLIPMNCKVGDRVLLPEYGGTPLKMGEEDYTLFCDCDILGKFEYSSLFTNMPKHITELGREFYFLLSLNFVPKILSIFEIRAGFGTTFPDSYS